VNKDQFDALIDMCERKISASTERNCPLCNENLVTLGLFEKHVAKHLVEVALFTLRDGDDGDSDSESDEDEDNVLQNENEVRSKDKENTNLDVEEAKTVAAIPTVPTDGPNYRQWIPADGIREDVIQADIQRYLGPDALVKPGLETGENAVCRSAR